MNGDERRGPLVGTTVVHLSGVGPGPFGVMLLADLGAQVILVDRVSGPPAASAVTAEHDPRRRGQRSICLDLKQETGLHTLLRLLDTADVLVEGFRPGVAERLGLGPDVCLSRNPRLLYARMTGWGREGQLADRAGHDINYLGMSGALHAIGPPDRPPVPPLNLLGDFGGGGTYLALGILAGLVERDRSGAGQVIDVSMIDGLVSLTSMFHGMIADGSLPSERGENLFDGSAPFYRAYETAGGGFVAVGSLEPQFYTELLTKVGLEPRDWPQYERSRWPQLHAELARRFETRTRSEWEAVFAGSDACVAPVLSFGEVAGHPFHVERGTLVEVGEHVQPGPVPRFSRSVPATPSPSVAPGSHTDMILHELGLSPSEVAQLRHDGVIGPPPPDQEEQR